MSKIRAYKLAEELGIDRAEFVEKAAAAGVELKSAMAQLDDDVVAELREKLGTAKEERSVVTERRLQAGAGAAVIRRRKKSEPEPVPEPVVKPEVAPAVVASGAPVPEPIAAEAEQSVEAEAEPDREVVPQVAPAPAQVRTAARSGGDSGDAGGGRGPAPSTTTTDRPAGPDRSGRERKLVREVVNLKEQERLARQATGHAPMRRQVTVDPRSASSPRRKRRDALNKPAAKVDLKEARRVVRVEGTVSVGELARMLGAKAPAVQRKLMALGTMVSINQMIDVEMARKVAAEFGQEVQDTGFDEQQYIETPTEAPDEVGLLPRAAVITVMGHVDHGKTSLLDAIRKTKVVAGEAGGITQHIGAYRAQVGDKMLTFIDTPGHAAFTEMRARGAQLTDVVILVVAATDGIMPQTIEAIEHARAANVPIVVAINKIDLPGASSQQTRQRLMEHQLVPEDFGGDTICVDVSATIGTGLEKLLEMVVLQSELLELKADPTRRASGVVIEAQLDKGRGPVATVLVQSGSLKRGDVLVVGTTWGRVRAMQDENGKRVDEAGPSVPVQITGLSEVPEAGQPMSCVESERVAKEIVGHREDGARGRSSEARPKVSLDEFFAQAEGGGVKELAIVLKADTQGSVEALRDALLKLSTDEVKVNALSAGVGAVTETDVMLAKASGAIVIAFHVRPEPAARRAASDQGVDVRAYQIIYDVVDEVKQAMVGLLPPTISEAFGARVEVRETFTVPKVGTIAGSYVTEGTVRRNAQCRLLRDGVQVYEGKVSSLRRFKDDVREVATNFECGIGIDGYNDLKVGDVIETFALVEQPATL